MANSIFPLYGNESGVSGVTGFNASFDARAKSLAKTTSPFAGSDTVTLSSNSAKTFSYGASIGRSAGRQVSRIDENIATDTSGTFAADIMRRIGDLDEESSKNSENAQRLENSLANTLESISAQYGRQAATAVMGTIYKSIGDGPVTEENLGQGFLEAIKLVDKNFGIAEGDKLIANLNEDLNKSLNEFFDNGYEEIFFATTPTEQLQFELSRAGQSAVNLGDAIGDMVRTVTGLTDTTLTDKSKKSLQQEIEEQLQRQMEETQAEKLIQNYGELSVSGVIGASLDISV